MGYLEGYGLISKHKGFLLIFLVLIISLIPSWLVRTLPISFKSADICWNLTFASDFGQSDQYSVVFGKNVYLTPVGHTVRYRSFVNLVQIYVLTDGIFAASIS